MTLSDDVVSFLERERIVKVQDLLNHLRSRNPNISEEDGVDVVRNLAQSGSVDLEDLPPSARSIREYLKFWQLNLDLYSALFISLVTVLAIYFVPLRSSLISLRWILGAMFVIFVPGFVLTGALFPKGGELDGIERFAVSLGLSTALVPLFGLALNYSPLGISLTPIVISMTIFTIGMSIICFMRRFKISRDSTET